MSRRIGNQWVPSSNQIQFTPHGAEATNCQHHVKFAANLNSPGAIDLTTPEGHHMISDIAWLAYFDGTTNVIIAYPQDSIGQVFPSLGQVLYTNAFTNAVCDVLYTYTRASFEQNIVIRQQLPSPEACGLSPENGNIWLQVWTEFSAAPSPRLTKETHGAQRLDFGAMKMEQGKAFSVGSTSNSVPVFKQWASSGGRTFLIESVPLNAIAAELRQLPAGSSSSGSSTGFSPSGNQAKLHRPYSLATMSSPPHQSIDHFTLPSRKVAKKTMARMSLASSTPPTKGFVLDYATINGSMTNFTFQSDTTYYVSDNLYLYGTTTVEGGTVVKNAQPIGGATFVYDDFVCLTSPYRPAIFTCADDDTVGETISGSSGVPSVVPGNEHLYMINSGTISNVRFSFAWNGYATEAPDVEIWDCQFIDCNQPITALSYNTNMGIHNVLITMEDSINNSANYCGCPPCGISIENNLYYDSSINLYCEHLTANVQSQNYMSFFMDGSDVSLATISLTNSIVVSPALNPPYNDGSSSGATVTTNAVYYASSLPANLFQTVGAGNYYLANNSSLRNAGTPNITPALLNDLQKKTTYPPIFFDGGSGGAYYGLYGVNYTTNMTLFPQAQRESGDAPDLGYHYDPIDYAFDSIILNNATVTVMPGTVISGLVTNISWFGLNIGQGGQFICQGTPTDRCWIVDFNTVQEQYTTNWATPSSATMLSDNNSEALPASMINCRFTDFSSLAQDAFHFYSASYPGGSDGFQDCQFHGGMFDSFQSSPNFTNCLFERVDTYIASEDGVTPTIRNNLFYVGTFGYGFSVSNAVVQDNLFWQTYVTCDVTSSGYGGHNASVTNAALAGYDQVLPVFPSDMTFSNVTFQSGPLGYYYYPTNSPLINADTNKTADQVGLYHYTTTTNQVKETNSFLDIGYHYVALGTNGLPVDTTGCGTPDYLRDANGNGLVDSGELSWTNAADLGLNVIITRPKNNSVIP